MCLYPRIGKNQKYTPNNKNGGNIPAIRDERALHVPIGCGNCIECRKQKARDWQVRLNEEIKHSKHGTFITLTFNDNSIKYITKKIRETQNGKLWILENLTNNKDLKEIQRTRNKTYGYGLDNAIATYAIRHWLENIRKKTKKSIKHWLVTELGHNGTENIHLHGIIWNEEIKIIMDKWQYGFKWYGKDAEGKNINYVNERTINYIVKYIHKIDKTHKYYKPIILTSAGIGNQYTSSRNAKNNKFNNENTDETYRTRTGIKLSLPIYYRNKLYTDEEREQLWINRLNKDERWVLGTKIKTNKNQKEYHQALIQAQKINKELGYGTSEKNWSLKQYEIERRITLQKQRLKSKDE